jgi:hypothetical protein
VSVEAVGSADRVRKVDVPQSVRESSMLSRIDYADTFFVYVGQSSERAAEQWAREILEGSPLSIRTRLLSGWSSLGLKIGTGSSERSVLGWQVRRSTPDFVLLGADSRIGMPGELMFKRQSDALLFATLVHHGNVVARALWATVEPAHVRIVRHILDQASRRLRP